MTTKLLMGKDVNGMASTPFNEIPFSDYTVNFPLDGTNAVSVSTPPNMDLVYFSFSRKENADIWVSFNGGTLGLPTSESFYLLEDGDQLLLESGDVYLLELDGTAGGNATLNPVARNLDGITSMSFFSDDACYVNLNFYNRSASGLI